MLEILGEPPYLFTQYAFSAPVHWAYRKCLSPYQTLYQVVIIELLFLVANISYNKLFIEDVYCIGASEKFIRPF